MNFWAAFLGVVTLLPITSNSDKMLVTEITVANCLIIIFWNLYFISITLVYIYLVHANWTACRSTITANRLIEKLWPCEQKMVEIFNALCYLEVLWNISVEFSYWSTFSSRFSLSNENDWLAWNLPVANRKLPDDTPGLHQKIQNPKVPHCFLWGVSIATQFSYFLGSWLTNRCSPWVISRIKNVKYSFHYMPTRGDMTRHFEGYNQYNLVLDSYRKPWAGLMVLNFFSHGIRW